jgi:Exopolysaccharide biosynthesis protein YbjH
VLHRHRNGRLLRCLVAAGASFIPLRSAVAAQDLFHLLDNNTDVPTLSQYGGVGLLDTRTARFLPEGYLAATISIKNPDDRIGFTFQPFPWLETTFRWSNNYAIRPSAGAGQGADRSFDVKVRLTQESTYVPELAIGLQDFLGTGTYGGEYIVGSKRIGRFDFSLGLGWGRLGSRGALRNPFGGTREGDFGQGGKFTWDYFQGPDLGVFGGFEYQPRIHNLKIQVEYNSDSYKEELRASGKDYGFPLNIGLSYRPWSGVDFGLSLMHGNQIGVRLALFTDLAADNTINRVDPLPQIRPREEAPASASAPGAAPPMAAPTLEPLPAPTPDASMELMRQALASQRLIVRGLTVGGNRIELGIVNEAYLRDTEAVSRAARALAATAPPSVEEFHIVTIANGIAVGDILIRRGALERLADQQSSSAELLRASEIVPPPSSIAQYSDPNYRRFNWSIQPEMRQSVFDPDNPFFVGIGIGAEQSLEIGRGWWLGASESILLYDTFNDIDRESNSTLPHVRSDIARYLKDGKYGFNSLRTAYYFKLGRDVYGRATAGYLEEMYAGVGGELLYRPFQQRWALGLNLFGVQQRDYNRLFDLLEYKTITGHATFYYETPWDISLRFHVGRYLARDYGYTFEAVRTFRTGVQVGAWFTITNVSAEQFGEGSFDKGIRIRIPMEWALPFSSRSVFDLALRPIQRDGGQMLLGNTQLYDMTQSSSYGETIRQWDSVFRP